MFGKSRRENRKKVTSSEVDELNHDDNEHVIPTPEGPCRRQDGLGKRYLHGNQEAAVTWQHSRHAFSRCIGNLIPPRAHASHVPCAAPPPPPPPTRVSSRKIDEGRFS